MKSVQYRSTACPECGHEFSRVRNSRQTRWIMVRYHRCLICNAVFRSDQDKRAFFEAENPKAVAMRTLKA